MTLLGLLPACGNTTLDIFDPERGLVAHWTLDETEVGAAVLDSSGHGHNGIPSTNPPAPVTSIPPVHFADARSLSFNGVDQLVEFGNPETLNISGLITLCAWARPDASDVVGNIVAHGYRWTPNQEIALRLAYGEYEMSVWDGVDHKAVMPIPAEDVGTWVHLCGVFDGSAYFLFHNGSLAGTGHDSTVPARVDAPWAIGARPSSTPTGAERFWSGALDDVRIYARALTAAEVAALYYR